MLYEPSRKTYYRFPSAQSISDLDSRMYFPEKSRPAGEDTRYDSQATRHVPERETYYDI